MNSKTCPEKGVLKFAIVILSERCNDALSDTSLRMNWIRYGVIKLQSKSISELLVEQVGGYSVEKL